jgi:hypothetical protein
MGKGDVRSALEAMGDDEVRERMAAGDFSDVGGLDLTDHERQLVQDAAADYPEVAGFDMGSLGLQFQAGKDDIGKIQLGSTNPGFQNAALYGFGKY